MSKREPALWPRFVAGFVFGEILALASFWQFALAGLWEHVAYFASFGMVFGTLGCALKASTLGKLFEWLIRIFVP